MIERVVDVVVWTEPNPIHASNLANGVQRVDTDCLVVELRDLIEVDTEISDVIVGKLSARVCIKKESEKGKQERDRLRRVRRRP